MAKHLQLLAILMFVQASLEAALGLLLVGVGPFIFQIIDAEQQQSGTPAPPGMEHLSTIMVVVYVGLGLVTLAVAVLRIVAGVRILKHKSRVLAIVSLATGGLTVLSCYCAPTAIGLAIFGLIVLLNDEVCRVFDGEGPHDLQQVAQTFE